MGDVGDYWREAKQDRKMADWKTSIFGSKNQKHKCNHPECREQIPARLYACLDHWKSLPRGIKAQICHGYKLDPLVWYKGNERAKEYWKQQTTEAKGA